MSTYRLIPILAALVVTLSACATSHESRSPATTLWRSMRPDAPMDWEPSPPSGAEVWHLALQRVDPDVRRTMPPGGGRTPNYAANRRFLLALVGVPVATNLAGCGSIFCVRRPLRVRW